MHGRNHNDSIAYIGFNSSTRSPSAEESRTYSRRMGEVMVQAEDHAEMQRRLGDRLGEVRREGYEIRAFDGERVLYLESYAGIHTNSLIRLMTKTFGYDEMSAMRLLTDSNTLLSVATERGGQEAIAMGIIETSRVPFESGHIKLAELTDFVVREDYRGGRARALFLAITAELPGLSREDEHERL